MYLYSDLCPTPFVPFAVSLFGCVAGVMVTASHNPKDDNGYKVYWDNGAQVRLQICTSHFNIAEFIWMHFYNHMNFFFNFFFA